MRREEASRLIDLSASTLMILNLIVISASWLGYYSLPKFKNAALTPVLVGRTRPASRFASNLRCPLALSL